MEHFKTRKRFKQDQQKRNFFEFSRLKITEFGNWKSFPSGNLVLINVYHR
jgi:hypothetical protein